MTRKPKTRNSHDSAHAHSAHETVASGLVIPTPSTATLSEAKTTPTEVGAGQASPAKSPTKLARIEEALRRPEGTTLAELGALTGWQPHSVRAALSGLRKAGHKVAAGKTDEGATVYRIAEAERGRAGEATLPAAETQSGAEP